MYKCEHFKIEELVPPALYDLLHEDVLWGLFDENLLRGLDWMQEKFGTCTINNWCWGGGYEQSGLRTRGSGDYREGSQHSVGKGADLKFKRFTAEQVRAILKDEPSPYIRRIENGVSWVHVDVRPKAGFEKEIYFFNP